MIVGVVAAVVVVAGVVWLVQGNKDSNTSAADNPVVTSSDSFATETATETAGSETVGSETMAPTTDCTYTPSGDAGTATPPTNVSPPSTGTVDVTLKLNSGDVGLKLDRSKARCGVNSLLSLASQGYFDNTTCHRLTTSDSLKVLQCGDPTGTGSGGPGYSFGDEGLANIPAEAGGVTYPRGTIAMANAGPDTNGSQFFLVYGDSPIGPNYSILGTIDAGGLKVLDAIAAKGLAAGGSSAADGAPKDPVTITTITVPKDAVTATAPADDPALATEEPTDAGSAPEATDAAPTAAVTTEATPTS